METRGSRPMATRRSSTLRGQIDALYAAGACGGLSDRQLLDRFVTCRDQVSELAFRVLVDRHGPMVMGVCRRYLIDSHDADDAFQATFLVLAKKAGSLRFDGSAGRWLHGVARRVAARARAQVLHRRQHERSAAGRLLCAVRAASPDPGELAELKAVVTEELARLPLRLQAAVTLCELAGASHEEAARRLGLPVGTVKSRLSRARARLRQRMIRRGLGPADLASVLSLPRLSVPEALIDVTSRAAACAASGPSIEGALISTPVAALTQGVLRTMLMTQLKLMAAAAFVILTGSALLLTRATAQNPAGKPAAADRAPRPAQDQLVSSDDEIDVLLLERAWAEAIPRRDAAVVGRVLADDFSGIDWGGAGSTRERYLADLVSGVYPSGWKTENVKARILGDTAIVTSMTLVEQMLNGIKTTNVYLKRQGRWRCVASHASQIGGREPSLSDEARALARMLSRSTVRPRFECVVERIHVNVGQVVKKGDALVQVFSVDLAKAKIDYLTAEVESKRSQRMLAVRRKLKAENAISMQLWVDSQNDAAKSERELENARSRLTALGLDDEAIAHVDAESPDEKALLIVRALADGTIIEVGAQLGNVYDKKDKLLLIDYAAPVPTRPARYERVR
jgi:RNA polymerase sigma factor (sigma-70 family)